MKLVTEEMMQAHSRASIRGAIEGAVVSGVVATAGIAYLNRRWPAYRALPLSLKMLNFIIIVAPSLSIQAERRGLEYDMSNWEGEGMRILDEKEQEAQKRWEGLSTGDKVADWADRHQYSLIMGSWAASMAIAGAIISRDKYQTMPQKIVQARMWAQGLTIGVLIAAGALTHSKRAKALEHPFVDHSWRDVLEQQDRDRQADAREKELLASQGRKFNVPI